MIHLTVVADELLSGSFLVSVSISELEGGIGRAQYLYRQTEHVDMRHETHLSAAEGAILAVFEQLRIAYGERPF